MKIAETGHRARRRANFTPMIDVVFLLLVFFMMLSRFGGQQGVGMALAGKGGTWSGPPRLVELLPQDVVILNGKPVSLDDLALSLTPLMATPDDPIILRANKGVSIQSALAVMSRLRQAGFARLVLLE